MVCRRLLIPCTDFGSVAACCVGLEPDPNTSTSFTQVISLSFLLTIGLDPNPASNPDKIIGISRCRSDDAPKLIGSAVALCVNGSGGMRVRRSYCQALSRAWSRDLGLHLRLN